jgi:hypothetical protein
MIELSSRESDLTVFFAQGTIGAHEIVDAYSHFLGKSPTRLVLWDFTQAVVTELDAGAMGRLAHQIAEVGRARRPSGRSAVLCGRQADFEIARMIQAHLELEGRGVQTAAFMERASALAWLADVPDE